MARDSRAFPGDSGGSCIIVRVAVGQSAACRLFFETMAREFIVKSFILVAAAAGLLAAGAAQAQSGPDVLKAKGCLNCHDMQKKKVGPAFKDVAAKHQGSKDAEGMLMSKLKEGKGHPKIGASDAELKAALQTVLSTK